MYYFTADEHYGHSNIIKYCSRPFDSVKEMDEVIINNHNSLVSKNDTVIHLGDFTLAKFDVAQKYISRLNGQHIFIRGSHDYWMNKNYHEIWEKTIDGQKIIGCHYAMRTWAASHYNSWLVYGHSHGCLKPEGKSWDVGVDNNNFFPVSFEQLEEIMENRPDNFNLVKNRGQMKTATAMVHVNGRGKISIYVEDNETQEDLYKLSNEELNERIIDWRDIVDNCIEEVDFDEIIIDEENK